jgi:hypothetical protein
VNLGEKSFRKEIVTLSKKNNVSEIF